MPPGFPGMRRNSRHKCREHLQALFGALFLYPERR
nr:MAG TPA: hypothetical protein [Caudoviricetes sp.]